MNRILLESVIQSDESLGGGGKLLEISAELLDRAARIANKRAAEHLQSAKTDTVSALARAHKKLALSHKIQGARFGNYANKKRGMLYKDMSDAAIKTASPESLKDIQASRKLRTQVNYFSDAAFHGRAQRMAKALRPEIWKRAIPWAVASTAATMGVSKLADMHKAHKAAQAAQAFKHKVGKAALIAGGTALTAGALRHLMGKRKNVKESIGINLAKPTAVVKPGKQLFSDNLRAQVAGETVRSGPLRMVSSAKGAEGDPTDFYTLSPRGHKVGAVAPWHNEPRHGSSAANVRYSRYPADLAERRLGNKLFRVKQKIHALRQRGG